MHLLCRHLLPCLLVVVICIGETAAESDLSYKLKKGQTFAYDVSVNWKLGGVPHRLVGRPLYQVHHMKSKNAVTMVIGRLRCEFYDGERWIRDKKNDYWFGTMLTVDPNGRRVKGMPGQGGESCPESVVSLMLHQIFPRIPYKDTDSIKTGGATKVAELKSGYLFDKGTSNTHRGSQSQLTQASPIGGGLVRLETNSGYAHDDRLKFGSTRARATFDNRRGLLLEKTLVVQETIASESTRVTVKSRLIRSAAKLRAAKQEASLVYAALPSKMVPLRFSRKQIKTVRMPRHYTMDDLPSQNTICGYYDNEYREFYAVQFVEKVGSYQIMIRFVGSGELKKIRVGRLCDPNRSHKF